MFEDDVKLIDSNEIGFIGINLRKGKKKGKDIRR